MKNKIKPLAFSGKWDLDPAPESTDHISIKDQYGLFINGKFKNPSSGNYFPSINPATEEKLSMIAEANDKDVNDAVSAARKAYNGVWSKMTAKERGKYIYRIARLIQEKSRELAVVESLDG